MRHLLYISILVTFTLFSAFPLLAQTNNVSDCNNPHINTILVNTNSALETAGFKLVTTKMITLFPKTITTQQVKIEAGKVYQLNFILPSDYKSIQISFINQVKEEIFKEKIKRKDSLQTVWNKTFTATSSGNFWIVINASLHEKQPTCMGFSILSIAQ